LNSASGDFRPNVRKDGLEIVFDSNRASGVDQDLYFATRSGVDAPWSTPFTAGAAINTAANETRGSFSRDGSRLLFGRAPAPEGMSDIYFSVREKVTGH
jgi:Tol biopolymer transport system component